MSSILDITEILNEYSFDIQEGIIETAQKVAKNGAKELKSSSPKRTGHYAKGWRVKIVKGRGYVHCEIHNATDYQLTHLLENGHLNRDGSKKTPPKVHIKPVEQKCIQEYTEGAKEIIKNGG